MPIEWRSALWHEIRDCSDLEIIIVTKRVGNVARMAIELPPHVILLATICTQEEANRDLPKLLALKAKRIVSRVGVSIEPMLGMIDLEMIPPMAVPDEDRENNLGWHTGALTGIPHFWDDRGQRIDAEVMRGPRLDWVVCGGESGPHARPMHWAWEQSLREQCMAAGVPYFRKQWGEWIAVKYLNSDQIDALYSPAQEKYPDADRRCKVASLAMTAGGKSFSTGEAGGFHRVGAGAFGDPTAMQMFRIGKRTAGDLLDGVEHKQFAA